jgi:hypothetical protein
MGAGGLGAVSSGVAHWVVWLVVPVVFIALLFGAWKLAKLLWALFG